MIKANELRISNLIMYQGEKYRVSMLGDMSIAIAVGGSRMNEFIKCEDIDPIPLTPEWLERFGFITLDAESDIVVWGLDDNSNGEEFSIVSDGVDFPTPLYFEYDLGYREIRKDIKYVHQLQNLYLDLMGEELKIKAE